jgi:hypothetical protein
MTRTFICTSGLKSGLWAGLTLLSAVTASSAQVQRYEPSTPTVSPYLNLFRENQQNRALPNYYSLVRPMQQQNQVNQQQQRLLLQQTQEIGQLQTNVNALERREAEGLLVAPTGKGSWFGRPGTRSAFLNTSRFYSQSGNTPSQSAGAPRR